MRYNAFLNANRLGTDAGIIWEISIIHNRYEISKAMSHCITVFILFDISRKDMLMNTRNKAGRYQKKYRDICIYSKLHVVLLYDWFQELNIV